MNLYKEVANFWKKRSSQAFKDAQKPRLIQWRREETTTRVQRPLRIDRARALGYKAKPGYVIVRTKVRRGARRMQRPNRGRSRGKNLAVDKTSGRNLRWMAETRTSRKYTNLEVLGSYWVGQDGKDKWFEIILVDPVHPSIIADHRINWMRKKVQQGRTYRGLTSAGRRARGLHNKGFGAEKARPSLRAHGRRLK